MFFCRQAAYLCRKLVIHFYRNAKRYFVLFKSVDRGCGLELADSGKEKESGGREGGLGGRGQQKALLISPTVPWAIKHIGAASNGTFGWEN